jgi:cytosine deaminase
MLVLSRLRDQSIIIGHDITVTVADIRGDKVRLGVDAPRSVTVHRKEIYDQIAKENRDAGALRPEDVPPQLKPRTAEGGNHSTDVTAHKPFLQAAIAEARRSLDEGGVPTGAVLVRNNQIIASGSNRVVQTGDPMAHAEIECLRRAGRQTSFRDTVLYTTVKPGHLTSGAILELGIPRVIFGDAAHSAMRPAGVEMIDLADKECYELMAAYLRERGDGAQ